MTMNLPNKLTILRVILILPFVLCLIIPGLGTAGRYAAVAIFIIAALTDTADGKIARKYNLITNFGKFMDPLADKLLVSAAMILLVEMGELPAWIVILIISREFIISGFRLVASDKGVVIAAGMTGKIKTVVQMFMVIFLLLNVNYHPGLEYMGFQNFQSVFNLICTILIYAALIMTIVSLIEYLKDNWQVLKDDE